MSVWKNGLLAGLAATIVLSVLIAIKSAVGLLPAVDTIEMLRQLGTEHFGLPASPVAAWIVHFAIGLVWGLVFAGTYDTWPGGPAAKGAVFAIMIWLLTMSMFMPMVRAGFFGTSIGLGAALAPLVLHLVFGVVLGGVFGRLHEKPMHRPPDPNRAREWITRRRDSAETFSKVP
jgi:uncharacterized membrane protein YagU involved in acid resistance